jgi:hypothetical protein
MGRTLTLEGDLELNLFPATPQAGFCDFRRRSGG